MHSAWTDRLSAYLDGELPQAEREAVAAHLVACPPCREVLDSLRRIVKAAPNYSGSVPPRDLWPGIVRAIDARRSGRSFGGWGRPQFTLVHLAAAAVLFAVVGSGVAWVVLSRQMSGRVAETLVAETTTVAPPVVLPARTRAAFDRAVADLERVLATGRDRLDSATVRAIEENLALIDRAIAEARAAMLADPTNAYLQERIAANLWQKVAILRRAAAVIQAL
jgi:anti-sigma factor RsiW